MPISVNLCTSLFPNSYKVTTGRGEMDAVLVLRTRGPVLRNPVLRLEHVPGPHLDSSWEQHLRTEAFSQHLQSMLAQSIFQFCWKPTETRGRTKMSQNRRRSQTFPPFHRLSPACQMHGKEALFNSVATAISSISIKMTPCPSCFQTHSNDCQRLRYLFEMPQYWLGQKLQGFYFLIPWP